MSTKIEFRTGLLKQFLILLFWKNLPQLCRHMNVVFKLLVCMELRNVKKYAPKKLIVGIF